MDFIRIEGLELDCIVGVRPRERRHKQPVRVDVALGLDVSRAARSGRIAYTCDYDRVADEATALLRFRQYQLIEIATEELAATLLALHPGVERVEVRLEKPAALNGRARAAAVEIARTPSDFPRTTEALSTGHREVLFNTDHASLYLTHIEPGRELQALESGTRRELDWHVAGEIECAGQLLQGSREWPHGRTEAYVNRGSDGAVLFSCVCRGAPSSSA
jgi:dihydroneopterin aldolase